MVVSGIQVEIVRVPTLGGSPAKCRIIEPHKRALIRLADDKMAGFPTSTRLFVILHELGHAVLNSGDEIDVDRWAFHQYKKTGLPLKGAVFALSKVLAPTSNGEHSERVIRQFYRAKHENFLRGKTSYKNFLTQTI